MSPILRNYIGLYYISILDIYPIIPYYIIFIGFFSLNSLSVLQPPGFHEPPVLAETDSPLIRPRHKT